jgi:hypothetical protein
VTERDAAVPTIARGDVDFSFVDEFHPSILKEGPARTEA